MKKIKVTIVINDFLVGGAQKLLADMLKYADYEKFEYSLVTIFDFADRANFYDLIPKQVSVHRLSFGGFFDCASWLGLWKLMRRLKPDVVMSHLFFSNTVMRMLKPFFGYKVISFEHNTYTGKTRFQIFLDRFLSRFSFRIVAVSQTVKEFTVKQEKIPAGKFEVITNGIDVRGIQEEAKRYKKFDLKKELGFKEEDKIIINVARLTPQKNQAAMIRAFADFAPQHPEYKLLILGGGGAETELKKQVKVLNLESSVFLLGSKSDIVRYYASSEFFLSPSFIEGFSIAHLEALACGLPLLSTKTSGADQILQEGKNGYFIKDFSSQAILSALEKMLQADVESMREFARQSAAKYDIQQVARRYENLFQEALS